MVYPISGPDVLQFPSTCPVRSVLHGILEEVAIARRCLDNLGNWFVEYVRGRVVNVLLS
jgi:hypothetical protein